MSALRKALAALFLVFATVAFALTPGERIVLFSGIHPVWQANFLGASSLPAGLTWTVPTTLRTQYDSTGKLTYGGNNLALYSGTDPSHLGSAAGSSPPTISQTTYGGQTVEAVAFPTGVTGYGVSRRAGATGSTEGDWSQINGVTYIAAQQIALSRPLTGGEVITVFQTGVQGAWTVTLTASTTNPTTLQQYYASGVANATGGQGTYVYSSGSALGSGVTVYLTAFQVSAVTYQTTPSTYNPTTSTAYYGPRFDYDPSTLAPAGLLVEEARTNYNTYSQNFGTGWTSPGAGTTITTSTGVKSPDGSSDMQLLTQTNTSGQIYGNTTGLTTTSTNYVASAFFKAGPSSPAPYFGVAFTDISGSYAIALFNSSDGTYANSLAARGSIVSYGSAYVGNGIYRCWVVASFTTIGGTGLRVSLNAASDTSYNTVAGQKGYAWGVQAEAGSFPTSYIPNLATGTTQRTADVITFSGVPLAALQGAQASVLVELTPYATASPYRYVLSNSAATVIPLYRNVLDSEIRSYGGTSVASSTIGGGAVWSSGATLRAASSWSSNATSVVANGGVVGTAAAGYGAIANMYLGSGGGASNFVNGWFRSLAIYNARLPDPTLKARSVVGAPY